MIEHRHGGEVPRVSVVIPNWNGMRWLDGVLSSIARQSLEPLETIIIDNGSTDRSVSHLRSAWPSVELIDWPENRGFAAAANAGLRRARGDYVAMVNTDIELADDWLEAASSAMSADRQVASVATKMVDMADTSILYDTGDFLRRDGATEQRGRFRLDEGRFEVRDEVFSACAGAAVYRREAVLAVGGFDELLFTYLEDVELGLRLRLAGHTCVYEPCVARHASGGSEAALSGGATLWVERNTVLIVARHFPIRWLGPVLYRQLAWAWHHARNDNLGPWLRGLGRGLRLIPRVLRERRRARATIVKVEDAIADRPWRGPLAGGHPRSPV